MKKQVLGWMALAATLPALAVQSAYMGAPARLATAANGAVVNQAVLENAKLIKHEDSTPPYKVGEGVWILPGASLISAVIEGPDGLIVWESGENMAQGRHYREQIRKISDKPIKAVIYSHTHYVLGTRALIEGERDVMVIGHPKLNANMQASNLGSVFPEVEPLQRARAYQHAQFYLPDQGPDAKEGFVVHAGERGFVPVNKPVQHGEELVVAGVRMKFLTEGGSDTDDCISVWLPDRKLALTNAMWAWMPNFYTPRGAKFRDPRVWGTAVRDLLALEPEYLIHQHGRAIVGKEQVRHSLENYLDFTNLVLDQTLRGILQGKGPDELRDFIKLPRHLAEDPRLFQSYGQLDWYAPYIMNNAIGWWDGDAANLVKLPPKEVSERLVPLLGGRDKLLAAVRQAQAKGELAWALELLNHQFRLTPDDKEVRQLKADLLRRTAQVSTASITRAFMLSQALALEGKAKLARVVPPRAEQVAANPTEFVYEQRVRIDPIKAQDVDAVMRFDFTDGNKPSVALHLRRGVVEFVEQPQSYSRKADYALSLDSASYAALFLNQKTLDDLVTQGKVQLSGDQRGASAFLALFDPFRP